MGSLSFCGGKTEPKRGLVPHIMLGLGDAVYMIATAAVFSVFVYAANNGDFRLFIAVGCAAGAALYHATLGRLVMLVSGTVANAIRTAISYAIVKPVVFAAKLIYRAAVFVGRNTVGRVADGIKNSVRRHATERARKQIKDDIRFADV